MSSEEMQVLWTRVLAGEVREPGTTSIRTLGILKDLDEATAQLFSRFCSAAVYLKGLNGEVFDASSPLKKASLTGFHATAKHIAAKAVSPSSETMRTI